MLCEHEVDGLKNTLSPGLVTDGVDTTVRGRADDYPTVRAGGTTLS
jgi:hypothetical protein